MCNTFLGPQNPISSVQYLNTRNKMFLSCLHKKNFKILAVGWATHTKSVLPKCDLQFGVGSNLDIPKSCIKRCAFTLHAAHCIMQCCKVYSFALVLRHSCVQIISHRCIAHYALVHIVLQIVRALHCTAGYLQCIRDAMGLRWATTMVARMADIVYLILPNAFCTLHHIA